MGPDPILKQKLEDQKLAVGQVVVARWHDARGRFSAKARVIALRGRSVQVELLVSTGFYPVGHRLELPRISDFEHWSSERGILFDRAG